ncbi:hypothetical protein HAX54_011298, partial [Datura stramonium]|nr:hypothetical protein [Datura stramonium]
DECSGHAQTTQPRTAPARATEVKAMQSYEDVERDKKRVFHVIPSSSAPSGGRGGHGQGSLRPAQSTVVSSFY